MASRAADWMGQAQRDLELAHHALDARLFEWACFASHQAAEKSVKALAQAHGGEARGHVVSLLLGGVLKAPPPPEVLEAALRLDKLYTPTRYPNGWSEGKPGDYYSREEAESAIADARRVIEFCQGHMA